MPTIIRAESDLAISDKEGPQSRGIRKQAPDHQTTIKDSNFVPVLKRVHGGLGDDYTNREFVQMYEQIAIEGQGGFTECFRTSSARKRIALGIFITVFNNLGGTPVISAYQSRLFQEIGFTGLRVLLISGFHGLAGLIGVIINIALVADRMGRKTSMCEWYQNEIKSCR